MIKLLKVLIIFISMVPFTSTAQTDIDAIMMEKSQLCIGPMYSHSSWKNYWEGAQKRDNANLGTLTTKMFSVMGAYGISPKLNLLFSVPYVKTNASAGTLHGMDGIQDLSFFIKWLPIEKQVGLSTFSLYAIGGLSIPLTNYEEDFMPLSIGLHSKTISGRIMLDYQFKHLFFTGSGTYVWRANIKLDRTSYYTTEIHFTNEVEMPNASNFNFRGGYRSDKLIAEAVVNKFTTLGGFDISKNNMPFPSNRMNATTVGVNVKYIITPNHNLSVITGGNTIISGRNIGAAATYYGAIYYILDFTHKTKQAKNLVKIY